MRTVWKWIIGIAIVLVVLGVLVGGAFLLRSFFNSNGVPRIVQVVPPNNQVPNGTAPFYGRGPNRGPGWMMPYGRHGFPMMGGRGFGLFPFAGIIGFLFFAALVALVVLGIIWLVRRQSRPLAMATPPAAAATTVPPASSVVGVHPCKNCSEPVQDNWKHCPNCGEQQ